MGKIFPRPTNAQQTNTTKSESSWYCAATTTQRPHSAGQRLPAHYTCTHREPTSYARCLLWCRHACRLLVVVELAMMVNRQPHQYKNDDDDAAASGCSARLKLHDTLTTTTAPMSLAGALQAAPRPDHNTTNNNAAVCNLDDDDAATCDMTTTQLCPTPDDLTLLLRCCACDPIP